MPDDPLNTETLWRKFSAHLRNFIGRKLSDEYDAEDVLQDIFLRIHKGVHRLEKRDRVQSWVFGIARRAIADHYRRKAREREDPAGASAETDHDRADMPIHNLNEYDGVHDVHEEVLSWLIPMIDELPERYRVPLRMADVEGKTQQEVAERLGLSLSGAKSRVQRGREKLGEVLASCCAVEFGREGRAVAYHKLEEEKCDDC